MPHGPRLCCTHKLFHYLIDQQSTDASVTFMTLVGLRVIRRAEQTKPSALRFTRYIMSTQTDILHPASKLTLLLGLSRVKLSRPLPFLSPGLFVLAYSPCLYSCSPISVGQSQTYLRRNDTSIRLECRKAHRRIHLLLRLAHPTTRIDPHFTARDN